MSPAPVLAVSDKPLKKNLTVYQNASFRLPVALEDASGQPITDLSGWSFKAQIRSDTDAALLLEFAVSKVGGVFFLTLAPSQTARLLEDARYDLMVADPTGYVRKAMTGTLKLDSSITELPIGG